MRGLVIVAGVLTLFTAAYAAPATARTRSQSSSKCTVKIGLVFNANTAAAANEKGNGTSNVTASDQQVQDMNQVEFDAINKSGGIGGCTAQPVYAVTSITSNDYSGQAQQACAKFAQDEKVFAVLGTTTPDNLTTPCLVKAKIPVVSPGNLVDFNSAPDYLYGVTDLGADRLVQLLPVWQGEGLLKKGTKLGIVWVDDPTGTERKVVNDSLKPALKKLGVTVTDFSVPFANGNNQVATSVSQMASAVLQFKQADVTQVLTIDSVPAFLFPISANSQDYHPIQLTTDNGNSATTLGQVIPPAAMGQVRSTGWNRLDWVPSLVNNPAVKPNSATEKCDATYKGFTLPAQNNGIAPYGLCDQLALLQQALKGKKPTVANLAAGVDGLGTSFVSASALGPVRFGKGLHDGVTTVQNFRIDPATKAAQPQGALITLKG